MGNMKEKPPTIRTGVRGLRLFATVMVIALLPRLAILFTGQRWLRSDEALVGLMAKHVVTRGETPWFLYGQSYGGGHAMLAWVLAPFAALFGPTGPLVNGGAMIVSLANVALLWFVLTRPGRWRPFQAAVATVLYALAPAVIYQSFLANGGNVAFLFGLLSLHFFLRVAPENAPTFRNGLLLGLTCGLAYYAMDYALVYALTYALLVIPIWHRVLRSRALAGAAAGGCAGVAPLLLYNVTHDWAHVRQMFLAPSAPIPALAARLPRALVDFFTRDGAALFTTHLDDFPEKVPLGAGIHFGLFLGAVLVLVLDRRGWRKRPVELICVAAIGVYLCLYALSKYSAEIFRTPRYFLPLYPFAAVLTAAALGRLAQSERDGDRPPAFRIRGRFPRLLFACFLGFLVFQALIEASKIASASAHREHKILTSGPAIGELGAFLESRDIHRAIAPYEIQARLIAATNEQVLASCFYISPLPRYAPYDVDALLEITSGKFAWACVFRRDFAFAKLGPANLSRARWERELGADGVSYRTTDIAEFVVYHQFSHVPGVVRRMAHLAAREPQKETARRTESSAR